MKYTLTQKANRAYLRPLPPGDLERRLLSEFSYQDPEDLNVIMSLYEKGETYPGMMREVAAYLQLQGEECEVVFAGMPERKYDWCLQRPYRALQEDAVIIALESVVCTVQAPPGVGKTQMIAGVVCGIGADTIILAPNVEPARQIYATLTQHTDIGEVGRVWGGRKDIKPCTVMVMASVVAALKRGDKDPITQAVKNAKVVIADECHKMGAAGGLTTFDSLESVHYLTLFSATPKRIDYRQTALEAVGGKPLYTITRAEALDNGLSVPLEILVQKVPPKEFGFLGFDDVTGRTGFKGPQWQVARDRNTVYKNYVVNNDVRNQMGIDFAKELVEQGLSVAIICKEKAHIHRLCDMWEDLVPLYDGVPDRKGVLDGLKCKRILAVATTLMEEAVDVPTLSGVALMGGGKSYIKLQQRIRCDRTFEGDSVTIDDEIVPLEGGYWKKDKGYVFYPLDHADGLTTHSRDMFSQLKAIAKEHRLHSMYELS